MNRHAVRIGALGAAVLLGCATGPAVEQPAPATVTTTTTASVATPAIPSDVSGSWAWNGVENGNALQGVLRLERSGTSWSGTITQGEMSFPLKSPSVNGGDVAFQVDTPDGVYTVKLKLGADGAMSGTFLTPSGMTAAMKAKRN